MKLDNEQLNKYSTDGYLLLKNVVDIKKIDELMDFVAHVITFRG